MFQFQIRLLAKEDIQEIIDYYQEKSSHITDVFLERLYTEFDVIKTNPQLFQKKYKETRVRFLKGFPYGIHYILRDETIIVLAILHTSRNPEIWKNR